MLAVCPHSAQVNDLISVKAAAACQWCWSPISLSSNRFNNQKMLLVSAWHGHIKRQEPQLPELFVLPETAARCDHLCNHQQTGYKQRWRAECRLNVKESEVYFWTSLDQHCLPCLPRLIAGGTCGCPVRALLCSACVKVLRLLVTFAV